MSSKLNPNTFLCACYHVDCVVAAANHLRAEKDVAVVEATYVVNSAADPRRNVQHDRMHLREAIEAKCVVWP